MFCESTEQMIWAVNNSVKKAKNWTFNYHELKLLTENGKQMRNMWDIPMTPKGEKDFGKHPSQKPIQVMDRFIIGLSNKKESILDPFVDQVVQQYPLKKMIDTFTQLIIIQSTQNLPEEESHRHLNRNLFLYKFRYIIFS